LTVHIVFLARTDPQQGPGRRATKYRYHVLVGDMKPRCRDLPIQICDAEDVRILKGVVSKDHVHMHVEYPQGAVSG
jgi:REP element-mobilizing transposase RayT